MPSEPRLGGTGPKGFDAASIWNALGITEHLGGPAATRRLLAACPLPAGGPVLDIGCGTGFTACLLAQKAGARVTALDLRGGVLQRAAERVDRAQCADRVRLVQGDAHALPFADGTFAAAVCESVLVFCDQRRALSEIARVVPPGEIACVNEMTYLRPPSADWERLFTGEAFGIAIHPHTEAAWRALFEQAGFECEWSEVRPIRLSEQYAGHLEVDGPRRYFSAVFKGLLSLNVWRTFFNPRLLPAWLEYPTIIGGGLYALRRR